QRYRRLTDRRDIAMSSVSVAEFRFQVEGIGGYAVTKPVAQRILWHHNDSPWGYVVSGNSDLKTIDDIKRGGVSVAQGVFLPPMVDRKSTRLNSSHVKISYAVFCLKKKTDEKQKKP